MTRSCTFGERGLVGVRFKMNWFIKPQLIIGSCTVPSFLIALQYHKYSWHDKYNLIMLRLKSATVDAIGVTRVISEIIILHS